MTGRRALVLGGSTPLALSVLTLGTLAASLGRKYPVTEPRHAAFALAWTSVEAWLDQSYNDAAEVVQ